MIAGFCGHVKAFVELLFERHRQVDGPAGRLPQPEEGIPAAAGGALRCSGQRAFCRWRPRAASQACR